MGNAANDQNESLPFPKTMQDLLRILRGPKGGSYTLPEGIRVANLSGIKEGYQEGTQKEGLSQLVVNVSAENIGKCFLSLASMIGTPGFFVVELPSTESEEKELRPKSTDPFHKNVYALNGISVETAEGIFKKYERLFVHDGRVGFGYGSRFDEVYVGPYKIFYIYAVKPEKYRVVLEGLGIKRRKHLRTVWDNFAQNARGRRGKIQGKPTAWDMLEDLKKMGFRFRETRED